MRNRVQNQIFVFGICLFTFVLFVGCPTLKGPKPRNIFTSDSFNRPDSSLPITMTDAALGGTPLMGTLNGVFGIFSSQARYISSPPGTAAGFVVNTGHADCSLELTITNQPNPGDAIGLIFRKQSINHFILIPDTSGGGNYTLSKNTPGGSVTVASYTSMPQNGDVIRAEFSGPNIVAKLNGNTIISIVDATAQSAVFHGYAGDGSSGLIDNFIIEDCSN